MKVQELARFLNLTGKEMNFLLRENNVYVKSQSAKLDPQRVTMLKQAHQRKRNRQQTTTEYPDVGKTITLNSTHVSVPDLAISFEVGMPVLMRIFLKIGKLYNINSEIGEEDIVKVASFLNI